jgi:two-component system chemotaxis response regulator CheB
MPLQNIEAIAIGVSTGGPNALAEVIPLLPADLAIPVFITQHMPAMFTRMLAERLTQRGKLPVHEVTDGMIVQAGQIYLAPGGWHLELRRSGGNLVTKLSDAAPENSCRPSVDVMLRSLVAIYGSHLLTTILTGMGVDGRAGCELAVKAGGTVLVQDEASSVVWGMPGAVVAAGLAHQILALPEIAPRMLELVRRRCGKKNEYRHFSQGGKL